MAIDYEMECSSYPDMDDSEACLEGGSVWRKGFRFTSSRNLGFDLDAAALALF